MILGDFECFLMILGVILSDFGVILSDFGAILVIALYSVYFCVIFLAFGNCHI